MVAQLQRVIQDILIIQGQDIIIHIPDAVILRDPEPHNTGEISALLFLDRPESKLKHLIMVLCVTGYLLHRIQSGIHMVLHDLLIIAFRDLPDLKPLRLADRPRQPKMPSRDPPQKLFVRILHIRDQCVRRAPLIPLCVFSP